jgi:hypothetical protein
MDTRYVLDPSDRVVAIDEHWIAFAKANDAATLADRVVGQSLWTFIAGPTVRELYRTILGRVRATGRRVSLPFRCDSPTVRRYMTLSMAPGNGPRGTLEFGATLVREEPQSPNARALYVAVLGRRGAGHHAAAGGAHDHADEVLTMCSVCKRLYVDGWCEIDEALERRTDLLTEPVRPVSHGLCLPCRDAALESVA